MPSVWYNKAPVLAKLIECGIYDLTWFCEKPESPTSGPCTNCHHCKTHMEALAAIATDASIPRNVQYKAVTELNALLTAHSKKVEEEKAEAQKKLETLQKENEELSDDATVIGDTVYLRSNVELLNQENQSASEGTSDSQN